MLIRPNSIHTAIVYRALRYGLEIWRRLRRSDIDVHRKMVAPHLLSAKAPPKRHFLSSAFAKTSAKPFASSLS